MEKAKSVGFILVLVAILLALTSILAFNDFSFEKEKIVLDFDSSNVRFSQKNSNFIAPVSQIQVQSLCADR